MFFLKKSIMMHTRLPAYNIKIVFCFIKYTMHYIVFILINMQVMRKLARHELLN
jgi:hypothetical protein